MTPTQTFEDTMSGKRSDRPGFQALCAAVANGEIDVVVVYRLDRLSRQALDAMQLLLDWMQAGIEFYAVDQPILHLGADNPFRLTFVALMSEIAQIERETIVARVKAGLRAAKARGQRLGRPRKVTDEQHRSIHTEAEAGLSIRAIAKRVGVSPTTVHRVLRS